jgi:23S rRNA (uracil-5-)-methyltransferase RumA
LRRGDLVEVVVGDISFPNIGLARIGDRLLEIKGGLPGQRLRVRITRKGRRNLGRIVEVLQTAPQEISAECAVFGDCGGCAFQNIPYEYEIELKTYMVKKIFAPYNMEDKFLASVPSPARGYRNKMEYSFGDDGADGNLTLGMRKKGSYYEAVDASGCLLPHADFGRIVAETVEYFRAKGATFYHRKKDSGTLRHLVIRHGVTSGEILVNLVTKGGDDYAEFAKMLLEIPLENKIIGILHTINDSLADAIVPNSVKTLHGRDFFHEMGYKIPAFSFFQTNSGMTEYLYATIAEFAGDLRDRTIFDLYCGAGTIAQFLARRGAKRVVGVEIDEAAVSCARENAANLGNCEFIAGDVKQVVKDLAEKPDIIVLDPPREGIVPKAIPDILAFNAQKIIYVSCKPTSLAANLPAFLDGGYEVAQIQCIDMFPRTANVEVVCALVRKG